MDQGTFWIQVAIPTLPSIMAVLLIVWRGGALEARLKTLEKSFEEHEVKDDERFRRMEDKFAEAIEKVTAIFREDVRTERHRVREDMQKVVTSIGALELKFERYAVVTREGQDRRHTENQTLLIKILEAKSEGARS